MRAKIILSLTIGLLALGGLCAQAAEAADTNLVVSSAPARTYVLGPNDLVLVKVYRQEDLESRVRIAADGTSTLPLLRSLKNPYSTAFL
jgi:protein involved in polysaccharide export with SLBB domain